MAFDHFVDVVKEHPEEAIQLATTVVGVVLTALGFAAGGGWWAANTLAKAKLELLQERRDFAVLLGKLEQSLALVQTSEEADAKDTF